jgi:RNA recognition motif-containing protein
MNIDISIDPFTFRNPSYCFVDLSGIEDASLAMQIMSGKLLLGRPLKVRSYDKKRTNGERPHADGLMMNRWQSTNRRSEESRAVDLLAPTIENRRVYLANLPKPKDNHSSDLEIRSLFNGFHNHGWYAFVDFATVEGAQKAVAEKDGLRFGHERLIVRIASGIPERLLTTVLDNVGRSREE